MTLMVSVSGVRGIVGPDLNPATIGRWSVALAQILPDGPIVVGRDSRPTGAALSRTATAFLQSLGREVLDVGIVPTPTVQLAVESWGAAGGLILTASHNPIAWNALKFVDHDGGFLSPTRFEDLRAARTGESGTYVPARDYGRSWDRSGEALALHREAVRKVVDVEAIRRAGLTVAMETGHGAGGTLLPALAADLGIEVIGFHLDPSGDLLENPEPTKDSLEDVVRRAPDSVAFAVMIDPDADRCGLAVPRTHVVGEEWTLPLVARYRLEREKGPLVTNLSTSTRIDAVAGRFGVPVHRTPVGEAHVVHEMRARGAVLGGEGNGGVIDPRVHLGRDAAVAFARLAEAHAATPGGLPALAEEFAPRFMLKEKFEVSERGIEGADGPLQHALGKADDRQDGLRWTLPDGFVHVRASNTEPILRAVVETASEEESRTLIRRIGEVLAS